MVYSSFLDASLAAGDDAVLVSAGAGELSVLLSDEHAAVLNANIPASNTELIFFMVLNFVPPPFMS